MQWTDEHDTAVRITKSGKPDRRQRHVGNPSISITVTIPISLRNRLDAMVVERRATRSGLIVQAINLWLSETGEQ